MTEMQIELLNNNILNARYGEEISVLAKSFEEQNPGALYDADAFAQSCFKSAHQAFVYHSRGWCCEALTTIQMLYKYTLPKWSNEYKGLTPFMEEFAKIHGMKSDEFGDAVLDLIGRAEKVLAHRLHSYDADEGNLSECWAYGEVQDLADRLWKQTAYTDIFADSMYETFCSVAVLAYDINLRTNEKNAIDLCEKLLAVMPDWNKEKELLLHGYTVCKAINNNNMMLEMYNGILFPEEMRKRA